MQHVKPLRFVALIANYAFILFMCNYYIIGRHSTPEDEKHYKVLIGLFAWSIVTTVFLPSCVVVVDYMYMFFALDILGNDVVFVFLFLVGMFGFPRFRALMMLVPMGLMYKDAYVSSEASKLYTKKC